MKPIKEYEYKNIYEMLRDKNIRSMSELEAEFCINQILKAKIKKV